MRMSDGRTTTPTPMVSQPDLSGGADIEPLLEVRDLAIHFRTPRGLARVVDGANLTVGHGEIVGIAGESGCGKTTLVEAILQIIRFPNRLTRGQALFTPKDGPAIDLMQLSAVKMRGYRGKQIAYVPQGSMNSLNPVLRVGDQIVDAMAAHGVRERDAKRQAPALLERVGLEARVAGLYPHELSGGMKQRSIIAIAIALGPSLIVADEPTTALDVNVQRQILETLVRLRDDLGMAILIVSHDLPVHAQLTDRVGVMYAGQIVETAAVRPAVKQPLHPYAMGLMSSIPTIGGEHRRLEGIAGATPSPLDWPPGCRFSPRCPDAMEICGVVAPRLAPVTPGPRQAAGWTVEIVPGRAVACHLYPESTP